MTSNLNLFHIDRVNKHSTVHCAISPTLPSHAPLPPPVLWQAQRTLSKEPCQWPWAPRLRVLANRRPSLLKSKMTPIQHNKRTGRWLTRLRQLRQHFSLHVLQHLSKSAVASPGLAMNVDAKKLSAMENSLAPIVLSIVMVRFTTTEEFGLTNTQ